MKVKSFDERIQEFILFKEAFGTEVVPREGSTKSLHNWCKNIRTECKKYEQGERSGMINEEHLNLLKDVGAFQRVNQKKFDERLEELRAFKGKYGTCKVPYSGDTMVLAT